MTDEVFQMQISRLRLVYGDQHYPPERVKVLHDECRHLTDEEFFSLTTELLGTYRFAPLLKEIRDALSALRERAVIKSRRENAQAARDFFAGKRFNKETERDILGRIRDRMAKRVPDRDWNEFMNELCRMAGVTREQVETQVGP